MSESFHTCTPGASAPGAIIAATTIALHASKTVRPIFTRWIKLIRHLKFVIRNRRAKPRASICRRTELFKANRLQEQ
jgi:hypothetical protein